MDKEDDLQGFEDPTNSHLSLSGRRHSFGASGCLTEDFLESVATLNKDKRYLGAKMSSRGGFSRLLSRFFSIIRNLT